MGRMPCSLSIMHRRCSAGNNSRNQYSDSEGTEEDERFREDILQTNSGKGIRGNRIEVTA